MGWFSFAVYCWKMCALNRVVCTTDRVFCVRLEISTIQPTPSLSHHSLCASSEVLNKLYGAQYHRLHAIVQERKQTGTSASFVRSGAAATESFCTHSVVGQHFCNTIRCLVCVGVLSSIVIHMQTAHKRRADQTQVTYPAHCILCRINPPPLSIACPFVSECVAT